MPIFAGVSCDGQSSVQSSWRCCLLLKHFAALWTFLATVARMQSSKRARLAVLAGTRCITSSALGEEPKDPFAHMQRSLPVMVSAVLGDYDVWRRTELLAAIRFGTTLFQRKSIAMLMLDSISVKRLSFGSIYRTLGQALVALRI